MSNSNNLLVFDLSKKINPETDRPFGDKFKGEFKVRRPTIADKQNVAMLDAGYLSLNGIDNPNMIGDQILNTNYIQAFFTVCGEEVPDWFDFTKMYDEDRPAVVAAFKEVSQWLEGFRPK